MTFFKFCQKIKSRQTYKVPAKNIDYCGEKAGETNKVHMINNEVSHALNVWIMKQIQICRIEKIPWLDLGFPYDFPEFPDLQQPCIDTRIDEV